jgi:hypothetical protein
MRWGYLPARWFRWREISNLGWLRLLMITTNSPRSWASLSRRT